MISFLGWTFLDDHEFAELCLTIVVSLLGLETFLAVASEYLSTADGQVVRA